MKNAILFVFLPLAILALWYVFGTNQENYIETIEIAQKSRLHFLKNSQSSPVKDQKGFVHPGFFNIDKNYLVSGTVKQNLENEQIAIELSGGKLETYFKYGMVNFVLQGKECQLILFQHLEKSNEYLLPFTDLTNGKLSYQAGRYLPVQYNGGDYISLDFNLAQSPFCAFNHDFSCPLPPKSNHLEMKILAGEKY